MAEPPRIRVIGDGPLVVDGAPLAWVVKGETTPDGPPRWTVDPIADGGTPIALCRCDRSSTKPFCDRWPERIPCFEEPEPAMSKPFFTWRQPDGVEGPIVALKPNGPIRVSGGIRIESEGGVAVDDGERASLCRCAHSNVMPFCDGSHKLVGFRDG